MIDQAALDAAVELAVTEILEVSAFEIAERDEADRAAPASDALTARLGFHGGRSGTLRLWIEPAEARALASALLGDGGLDDAMVADTVAELANMVAGHVLSRVFIDTCIALDHATVDAEPAAPTALCFIGEHGRIGVTLEVNP